VKDPLYVTKAIGKYEPVIDNDPNHKPVPKKIVS
jgi:hypothetical protein